ncbi:glycosyltransferase family 2 protein [Streptomyces sp. WAC07061]|uniref:glycosyltransferase family 2 protein n=1 Tax=Streptomyces sp. WAC07061 TaxID=2487410 RepID=UPI000F7B4060|nr:glycosyltransferase family 2 protein [Streptomyces sp. WAC07061]RSS56103.1 glycosyltransferase family 2 protein [Streptomyces sp. WAC07061]
MLKLSVVVPFHNVQAYAPDALKSLELNARGDFEFLLVDDRSTDGTPALLERAAAGGVPGAVHLRRDRNGGLATARNTGLDAARGEYVAFLDGDDWLAPGHLARTLAAIEALGCDFVRTDHVQVTGRSRVVQRVPYGPEMVVGDPRGGILPASRATAVDYPYAWAGMYHRRLLDRGLLHFTDGLRTAEDRPWIWRLHREAASFAAVGLPGVFYRRGIPTSLTQIGDERQLDFIRAFDQVLADVATDRESELLIPKAVRTYCAIIAHHIGSSERFEPAVAKKLRFMSAAALGRMPAPVLDRVIASMDAERSALLRGLRRRRRAAGAHAAGQAAGYAAGAAS